MLTVLAPASTGSLIVLAFCLILVLVFEFSNGFHDTANAVATVIYTKSLDAVPAVILSGTMNFLGVMLGGVAVAYTMVELLPPEVLTPPNGNPATAALLSLFVGALIWNISTWWLGIPCSSSHALIGALLGVGLANSIIEARGFGRGVDWDQVRSVGEALLFSPIMGFVLAGALFKVLKMVIRDGSLFKPPEEGKRPPLWLRILLIGTCSGVSFAHGSNDGQKSIGLIMLTIIGLLPVQFALNRDQGALDSHHVADVAESATPLIQRYGDDEKDKALQALGELTAKLRQVSKVSDISAADRIPVRHDIYQIDAELKYASKAKDASADDKKTAKQLHDELRKAVEYAPLWVRVLSALCLGFGTMVGYRRIVHTIGERIGKQHMTPGQGASAELVGGILIGTAGFSGLPVSTTHIISSGVAGTMAADGAGVQSATVRSIVLAWLLTLPATILLSGGLFYLLAGRV
jgi:PiT family inorganic phosphate transporter